MIRRIFQIILPIAIIAVGVMGFNMLKSDRVEEPAEIPKQRVWLVEAQQVSKQTLTPNVELLGRIVTPSFSSLSSILEAEVTKVNVVNGQEVKAGEVLIELDSRSIETLLRQTEADIARIRASIDRENQRLKTDREILEHEIRLQEMSAKSLLRAQTLKSRNLISQAEFDSFERASEQSRLTVTVRQAAIREFSSRIAVLNAELKRAEASLDKARLDLEDTIISAPYSGRVTNVHVAVGTRVRNGTQLLDMYDQTLTEVRTLIPSRFIESVRNTLETQMSLKADTELDGHTLHLELNRLSTTVEPGRGGIDAYFKFTSSEVFPELGRPLSLNMSLTPITDAIAIPYPAVYGSNQIFMIESERMASVNIIRHGQTMLNGETYIVATSDDLQNGDQLIITQLANASEGLSVRIQNPD